MRVRLRDESGAVLAFAVLVALALLVLGHSLLVSAESAYTTSRAHARIVQDDWKAEAILMDVLDAPWATWLDSVPQGGRRTFQVVGPGGDSTGLTWRRLSQEGWLLTARPESVRGGPTVERRRLVWVLNAARRIVELPAVVSVAAGAPTWVEGAITGDTTAIGVVAMPGLGLLSLREAMGQGQSLDPGGTPAPSDAFGTCDTSARWNWGDPDHPTRPCGSHTALRSRVGDVVVAGGRGRVVLFVDGDATFQDAASVDGLVVASGVVRLEGGASIRGRVLAYGGLEVEAGSSVVGSLAVATAALEGVRELLAARGALHPAHRLGPG